MHGIKSILPFGERDVGKAAFPMAALSADGKTVAWRGAEKEPKNNIGTAHVWSGRLAVLVSVPVAVHCLYALGFQSYDNRVLFHSLFGCFFYGAFVTKMVLLTRPRASCCTSPARPPARAAPATGSLPSGTPARTASELRSIPPASPSARSSPASPPAPSSPSPASQCGGLRAFHAKRGRQESAEGIGSSGPSRVREDSPHKDFRASQSSALRVNRF